MGFIMISVLNYFFSEDEMTSLIIISALMCTCLIAAILLKPSVKIGKIELGTYWLIALTGAIILVLCKKITLPQIGAGLVAKDSINPLKILILFLSMTIQSIFLDEVGMFRYCANLAGRRAGSSRGKLFLILFAVVSVLTVFTSNDIIILTFTPFICYFSKNAGINPIPYLFLEFVAANTWSMMLIIGNPTNVYLAASNGINFLQYTLVMWLPTLTGGTVALIVLWLIFRKELKQPMTHQEDDFQIKDKGLLIIGLIHLVSCTVLLVISSYIGLEMWLITFCFAVSLYICAGIYLLVSGKRADILLISAKRAPWELIPFVLSMFVFVLAFDYVGLSDKIGELMAGGNGILKYGIASFVTANLINNIPMSVLFSSIVKTVPMAVRTGCIYGAIVGSNIGAFFTPVGALAGIMWTGILKKHDVKFSFVTYIKYGLMISVPTLLATLLGLMLVC